MIVELINTGSELLLGRVLNTHQQWLCRKLSDAGYVVTRQVAVPDTGQEIQGAVRESLSRADLVITTGGLGPTSDDLTRELIAELLGKPLIEDPAVLAHIESFFKSRGRRMPQSTRVQARIPEGAIVLHNPNGTAPGLAIKAEPNPFRSKGQPSWLIMLPGPPRELRPMFLDHAFPIIRRELAVQQFRCLTLRALGLGESLVEERVSGPLQTLVKAGLQLGYCARPGQVDVRLLARGERAEETVAAAEAIVRKQLGNYLFGADDEDLEVLIVRTLTDRKQTLALAESCTGGCIAHKITNVPGASAVLLAGWVTYSNESKSALLGVRPETLQKYGAVSEPVAREMVEGALRVSGASYAISVTGIAGPGGGSPEKPVGTVFIAMGGPFGIEVMKQFNPLDRESFKGLTAQQALDLLRRKIVS
jgi:nicotinamide-nucleotide amidase